MKKMFKTLLALSGIAMMLTGCNGGGETSIPPVDDYYASISDSLTGNDLRKALQDLNWSRISARAKNFDYDSLRPLFAHVDRAVDTPEGKIVGFYNNEIMQGKWNSGNIWNREHCWPKSKSGNLVENDLHMVRPCSTSINEGRGNAPYGKGSSCYDPAEEGCPEYRGVAARIIFYCAMKIDALSSVSKINTAGVLTDMLEWNLQYPPTDSLSAAMGLKVEWNRNNLIQNNPNGQGNRNPFIDHPEYACKIWGSTNSTTKRICGM